MNLIKYSLHAILILTIVTKINGQTNNLCVEFITGLNDEGQPYNYSIPVCCDGYSPHENGQCMPVCNSGCPLGICVAPNVCECKSGYEMQDNKCRPICKNKCINGYCFKPNVCKCINGFEINGNNTTHCIPKCDPKCSKFSKCTKSMPPNPNRCQCISGYAENKQTKTCEPVCKNKCTNGYCSSPETCACFKGFGLENTNKTNCVPVCTPNCTMHSSCIAPDICECHSGYKLNALTGKCDPICKDQIKYSICLKPPNTWSCIKNYQHDRKINKCVLESCLCKNNGGYCLENESKCECYDGFTKNITTGKCDAICQPNCKNSLCVANNVCECLNGYHKTSVEHICEHNNLCNGETCENGECLATGECKCKSGFVKSLSYDGKELCDKVQTFVVKFMIAILGPSLLLAMCTLIIIYVIAKKKSYNVEEQEMVLIGRN